MLIMTVAMVRVIHAGMKMFGKFVAVLDLPVTPLETKEGAQVSAANPNMMMVINTRRREEDLVAPAPWEMSWPALPPCESDKPAIFPAYNP